MIQESTKPFILSIQFSESNMALIQSAVLVFCLMSCLWTKTGTILSGISFNLV